MAASSLPPKPPLLDALNAGENVDPNVKNKLNISGSTEQKELTKQQQFARTGAKDKEALKQEKKALHHQQKQDARAAAIHHRRVHTEEHERRDINMLNSEISREIFEEAERLQAEIEAQAAQAEAAKAKQDGTLAATIRDAENRLAAVNEKIAHLDQNIIIQTEKIQQLEQQHHIIQAEVISIQVESKQHEKQLGREHREAERVAAQAIEIQAAADDFLKGLEIHPTDTVSDKAAKLTESWKAEIDATEKDIETMDARLEALTEQIASMQSELKTANDQTQQASISEALAKLNAEYQALDWQRDWQQWGLIGAYDAFESAGDRYTQKQAKADRTRAYHAKTVDRIEMLEAKLQALQAQHEAKSKALSEIGATLDDHKAALQAMETERTTYLAQKAEIESELKQLQKQSQTEISEIKASDDLGIAHDELASARDSLLKMQKQLMGMTQKALPNFENRLENLEKKIEHLKKTAPQSPELLKLEKQRESIISNIDKTQRQITQKEADIIAQESKIKTLEAKFEQQLHGKDTPQQSSSMSLELKLSQMLDAKPAPSHDHTHHKGITPKYELHQASQREAAKAGKDTKSEAAPEKPTASKKHK